MPEQDPPPIEPGTGRLSYDKQRRVIVASAPTPRPGTLTITYGDRRVTLDPADDQPKFDADRQKAEILLNEVSETFAARR